MFDRYVSPRLITNRLCACAYEMAHATIAKVRRNRSIKIVFVGDLNSDWVINILDLTVAAPAFGTRPGSERWNQVADVNRDGVINIVDIALMAREFGIQYVTAD